MSRRLIPTVALLSCLTSACEEHTTEPDLAVEACEHLKQTPAMVSGTVMPALEILGHKRYDVSLLDPGTGGATGTVRFQMAKAGHLSLFITVDEPVKVSNPNGGMLMLAMPPRKSGPCPELKAWHEFEAGVGPHLITLGGTTTRVNSIGLVVETEDHEH